LIAFHSKQNKAVKDIQTQILGSSMAIHQSGAIFLAVKPSDSLEKQMSLPSLNQKNLIGLQQA